MICINCGKEINDTAVFCASCGSKQTDANDKQPEQTDAEHNEAHNHSSTQAEGASQLDNAVVTPM